MSLSNKEVYIKKLYEDYYIDNLINHVLLII